MKVQTRNWGPEYQALSNLMGLKSVALRQNEANLTAEVNAHDGSHAYGRHGAQTGWESQFIRAVTKVTPDQAFDPRGVGPSIRAWNGAMTYRTTDGAPVPIDLFAADQGDPPTQYSTSAGDVSGGFATPEAQFLARARGDQVIGGLVGPTHYCAQYLFKTGPKLIRAPLNAVHVVVGGRHAGGLYGVGFARRNPRQYPNLTRAFAIRCLEGFQNRDTWEKIVPKLDVTTFKFNLIGSHRKKIAFPQLSDLFEFFDLDVMWQKSCSLIYRRVHNPANNSHSAWRLITMFPDDLEPGWAPSLWLSQSMKDALKQQGMNANVKDYHWTGLMSSRDGALKQRYTIPAWADNA
jgi:hypothetical protein